MEIAESMYLGGKKIHAKNPSLSLFSYRKLGLRCTYCGEPVCYRRGLTNQPHFAHFPSINPKKYEQCLLRQQSVDGSFSSNYSWWDEQYGKGQRFQLFQKHFTDILKSKIPDLDISALYAEPQEIRLNKLQSETLAFAKKNEYGFLRYIRIFNNQATSLEREIICEAFDYLIVASSKNIFKIVSDYLLEKYKTFQSSSSLESNSVDLCSYILMLLEGIPWLEVFSQITRYQPDEFLDTVSRPRTFVEAVKDTNNLYVYFFSGKLWWGEVDRCYIKSEELLVKFDFIKLVEAKWAVRKIEKIIVSKNPQKLLKINRESNIFSMYEGRIKKVFLPKVHAAIQELIGESYMKKKATEPEHCFSKNDKFILDKTVRRFWETGQARIILQRGKVKNFLAEIFITKADVRYETIYVFGNFLIPCDEYHTAIKSSAAVEDAIARIIQRIHVLMTKVNHKIT